MPGRIAIRFSQRSRAMLDREATGGRVMCEATLKSVTRFAQASTP